MPKTPSENIKPAKTFSIVCPAIILANNLIDKLIGLDKYDIISEKNTKRGILASEVIDMLPKTISQIEEESKRNIEVNKISNA